MNNFMSFEEHKKLSDDIQKYVMNQEDVDKMVNGANVSIIDKLELAFWTNSKLRRKSEVIEINSNVFKQLSMELSHLLKPFEADLSDQGNIRTYKGIEIVINDKLRDDVIYMGERS